MWWLWVIVKGEKTGKYKQIYYGLISSSSFISGFEWIFYCLLQIVEYNDVQQYREPKD